MSRLVLALALCLVTAAASAGEFLLLGVGGTAGSAAAARKVCGGLAADGNGSVVALDGKMTLGEGC